MIKAFWVWVYHQSQKKLRNIWVEEKHSDLRCPKCKTWMSISIMTTQELVLVCDTNPISGVMSYYCGQCGEISYWNTEIAPVAIRCDEKGTPINK
jgi:DNA-directed RNA polymerase subunit RPC12/RpoP